MTADNSGSLHTGLPMTEQICVECFRRGYVCETHRSLAIEEGHKMAAKRFQQMNQDEKLVEYLKSEGYYNVRILNDDVICNHHFIFTDAVLIECTYTGYTRRVCYPRGSGLAEKMCLGMVSIWDEPFPGYTAIK
jgi:hypothetical protein